MFRSLITSLSLLTTFTPKQTIFITPLYFGVAHIHHFYESRLTNPRASILGLLVSSMFQFLYTTLFGWYANFVFVRTGSIYSVILIHSFCNWIGFPRLWGRVEGRYIPSPSLSSSALASASLSSSSTETSAQPKGQAYRPPYQQEPLGITWTIMYYFLLGAGLWSFRAYFWILTTSTNKLGDI